MITRFDIAEAYYLYYIHWHVGGLTERAHNRHLNNKKFEAITTQLKRIKYLPTHGQNLNYGSLTRQGKLIYSNLVARYEEKN